MAAILHFLVEVTMFKTMSLKAAANPMIIAGESATSAVATDCTLADSHETERYAVFRLPWQYLIDHDLMRALVVIICRAVNSMDGSWVELLHQSVTY